MTRPETEEAASVLLAARRGARSVGATTQVADDAAEHAFVAWTAAVLRDRAIVDVRAWAFRVGANAARRLAGQRARLRTSATRAPRQAAAAGGAHALFGARDRARLQALLAAHASAFCGRQLEVLEHLLQTQDSFHAAARALGMDRSSLRRSFHSGLQRLRTAATSRPGR